MSPTVLTLERFRVGVSALVRFEIEHAAEIFATHVTAVRLFSCVCSHVYLKNKRGAKFYKIFDMSKIQV